MENEILIWALIISLPLLTALATTALALKLYYVPKTTNVTLRTLGKGGRKPQTSPSAALAKGGTTHKPMRLLQKAFKNTEQAPVNHPAFAQDNLPANFQVISDIVEKTITEETGHPNEPLAVSIAWNICSSLPASVLIPKQALNRFARSKKNNPKPRP